jgi:hypothetical protein
MTSGRPALPPYFYPDIVLPALLAAAMIFSSAPSGAAERASPSFLGPLGLNTIPSARMDAPGTIRGGVMTLDPYLQGYVSFQPAAWMNIGLRQTAEISSLKDDADRLYPGLDLKFRLRPEGAYAPEISVGMMSALGHTRMAGEYIAASKRYHDFDFTAGVGWGRYGASGTMKNPLSLLGGRYDRPRALDGETPNDPTHWFTGDDVGIFAGVEYHTPIEGLSLKLDWGADRYLAEKTAFDFKSPDPWSIGVNYRPTDWLDMGVATVGGDKIMANLSFKTLAEKWPGRSHEKTAAPTLRPSRSDQVLPAQMAFQAAKHAAQFIHDIRHSHTAISARFDADPMTPIPQQIGHAARHVANYSGATIEEIYITPEIYTLHGLPVRLMRRDLERAMIDHRGSAEEIWRSADLNATLPPDLANGPDVNATGPSAKRRALNNIRFILDLQTSLGEEDIGLLYRTGAIIDTTLRHGGNWVGRAGFRINGFDNLDDLDAVRLPSLLPVRSDAAAFAGTRVAVEHLFESWLKSTPSGEWHSMAAFGYLEEMYAGVGGEILYRPTGKTWALGAEGWWALKRDPYSFLNLDLTGDRLLTGHLKAWYEIPDTDLTLGLKAGRYLAEDWGATLSLTKSMRNGLTFEAFATATTEADFDPFGGTTHLYSGVKMTLPFGNVPLLPRGSHIRATTQPIGRDAGQALENPMPLYTLTTPFSTRAMIRDWGLITE